MSEKAIDKVDAERRKLQQSERVEILALLGHAKIKLHSTGLDRLAVADYASKIKVMIKDLEKEFEEAE